MKNTQIKRHTVDPLQIFIILSLYSAIGALMHHLSPEIYLGILETHHKSAFIGFVGADAPILGVKLWLRISK
ncbi:MAG: hypothetical protein CMK28_05485 [Porticoccaceae bacterium]|nr:hypothetical protein [Porticoccaceae bacterium]